MEFLGIRSWEIGVSADDFQLLFPLWLRHVDGIDVPPGPLVPGPLDAENLPPAAPTRDDPRLGEAWLAWWLSLVEGKPRMEPPADLSDPYTLARLPAALRDRATRRIEEHERWHAAGNRAGRTFVNRRPDVDHRGHDVVTAVEAALGRRAKPFRLQFTLLQVRDDRVLRVAPAHYLVPERVFLGPDWVGWLRPVVERIA